MIIGSKKDLAKKKAKSFVTLSLNKLTCFLVLSYQFYQLLVVFGFVLILGSGVLTLPGL